VRESLAPILYSMMGWRMGEFVLNCDVGDGEVGIMVQGRGSLVEGWSLPYLV
jgi:hypothetical protein